MHVFKIHKLQNNVVKWKKSVTKERHLYDFIHWSDRWINRDKDRPVWPVATAEGEYKANVNGSKMSWLVLCQLDTS